MSIRTIAVCVAMGAACLASSAQMNMGGSAPAAGTIASPAKAVDAELNIIEIEMMGAVRAMPADKYGFAPRAAIFVPSQKTEFATVRTFLQQVTHVADANYFFYQTVSGLKPEVDLDALGKISTKEDAVKALAASFAYAHKAIATLTPANAFEVVKTDEMGLQTRATFAQFAVSHANDHYGQMVEYLRMNGIVPPASAGPPAK